MSRSQPSSKPLLSPDNDNNLANYHSIINSPPDRPSPSQLIQLPLPRPRLWPLLPFLAMADLIASLHTFLDRNPSHVLLINPHRYLILSWTTLRAIVLGVAGSSRRLRSLGWVFASTGMISIILLFWDTNEFVQRHQGDCNRNGQSFRSYLLIVQLLLLFPMLHWFAFLVCVGVANSRNPFIGNSLGFGSTTQAGYWNWAESVDPAAVQRVVLLEEEEEGEELESSDEEADPDDIQDIPPRITPLTPALPGSAGSRTRSLRARSRRESQFEDQSFRSGSRVPSSSSAIDLPLPASSPSQLDPIVTNLV